MIEVYRDDQCYVTIDDNPVTLGHIRVYPAQEASALEDVAVDHISYLFTVASFCATALFEGLKAHGTNIICRNGANGQVCVEAIARSENDGLGLFWEPKQGDMNDVQSTAKKVKDALIDQEIVKKEPLILDKPVVENPSTEASDEAGEQKIDWRFEHLKRSR